MLRSPKSTQRKIRQLELILAEDAGSSTGDISDKLGGPASNQVDTITCDGNKLVTIKLKQAFAAAPCVIANNAPNVVSGKKGGTSDEIQFTITTAGLETHLLIIGSDITEKY
jgi:hypothetical protein